MFILNAHPNSKHCLLKTFHVTTLCYHFGAFIGQIVHVKLYYFFTLLAEHNLKAHFDLVPADIMKNQHLHPVSSGK